MARTRAAKPQGQNKAFKRAHDLRRKLKDEDVIYEEYKEQKQFPVDVDLPGLGQFYCFSCSKHNKDQTALSTHYQSTQHKKLLRRIRNEKPWTLEEANAAGGMGSYRYSPKGLKPGEKTLAQKVEDAKAETQQGMAEDNAQVVLQPATETKME